MLHLLIREVIRVRGGHPQRVEVRWPCPWSSCSVFAVPASDRYCTRARVEVLALAYRVEELLVERVQPLVLARGRRLRDGQFTGGGRALEGLEEANFQRPTSSGNTSLKFSYPIRWASFQNP